MKRFILAAVGALAVAAVSQQQAQAWFNFGIGGSANTNISWGGLNVSCRESEPWPTRAYGLPQYNNYGPSNSGPPSYPVNPYGMQTYGGIGAPAPFGPAPVPPQPVLPGPQGSGSPMSFNYAPQRRGYGFGDQFGGTIPYAQPMMPYAYPYVAQPALAYPAGYYYGR